MKLHVWKNDDGFYLSRPPKPSSLTEIEFDPDEPCRQCGERLLSISADGSDLCPWCDSSMNRPKILRYQEQEIVQLLKQQSEENAALGTPRPSVIGSKGTEKDLRDYLQNNGYYGRSAKFVKLKLAAIERPGWVQVFEFHVQAKRQTGEWTQHFGLCRSDERNRTFEVQLFDRPEQQRKAFQHDTSDMITHARAPRHWSYLPLMLLFLLLLGLAVLGAAVNSSDLVTRLLDFEWLRYPPAAGAFFPDS